MRVEKLANAPGKTLTVVIVNYAPGGKSGPHRHAGSVFAYVLSGAIRSENSATGPVRVYRAGESFFEPIASAVAPTGVGASRRRRETSGSADAARQPRFSSPIREGLCLAPESIAAARPPGSASPLP